MEQPSACQTSWDRFDPELLRAPDYLSFERGIYHAFIKEGILLGDTVVYKTSFGVELLSVDNKWDLSSFLGFRKASPDGSAELIDQPWKLPNLKIRYTKKQRS